MKQFEALTLEALTERLLAQKNVLILFHRNPDADAVGSAFALKNMLEQLGINAFCVCSNEIPDRLRFLTDEKQASVLPEAIPEAFSSAYVISVDTASPSQLGALYELFEERVSLMIDHHGKGEPYADHYIRPDAAATGEILFDLTERLLLEGLIQMTPALSASLYAAISSDTGCFRFSNVTPSTHRRAAILLEYGVDAGEINHLLFDSNTPEQLMAQAAAIGQLRLFQDGKIALIPFPFALKEELGLKDEHLEGLVDVARSVIGVKLAITLRQPERTGVFRVSMRSSCDFDVSAVCAELGGGGHKKAAGCTVHAEGMEDAIALILSKIQL